MRNSLPHQKQLKKAGLLWVALSLILLGCEAVTDFLPPLPGRDRPVKETDVIQVTAQSPEIAEMETQVRLRIDEIRQQQGLKSLEHHERLAQVARNYSQKMARQNFFSHVSPDGDTPGQRVRDAGIFYWMVGENLFMSQNIRQPVPAAVKGWMESPGHRANILTPEYTQTGIGIWREGNKYYITQLFMRSQISLRNLFPR